MCGIAGYIGNERLNDARLTACTGLMHRRGPDAHGQYHHERNGRHVHLLHSRLSIIDLNSGADQPFLCDAQALCYNGELYNYLELRAEMEKAGHAFRTRSDTEVLARALAASGATALERCEGMWAFAHYDEASGRLLLARDRFGEKPLYLFAAGDGLYFGSEVKFIQALLGQKLDVNHRHLHRYLVNGYKSLYKTTETFFAGVRSVDAGTTLAVDADGRRTEVRYWRPSFVTDDAMSYDDAVAQTRTTLIDAVGLRLRADVPLAFCMSGGVDSNALISIAKRVFKYDVHGFTIMNTDARYEEQDMVKLAVADLGIAHTPVPIDPTSFLDRLRQLVVHHDAPIYTISYYVHWLLMAAVHDAGYKISISGTAADELFSGYYDHYNAHLAMVRKDRATYDATLLAWQAHVQPVVRNPYLGNPDLFVSDPSFRGHIYLDADKFAGFLTTPWSESFAEEHYCDDLMRNRMANELFHESIPVILHEDDLNAMYYSIENRSPFLDSRLFDSCRRIPTRHLIRNGYNKAVLRDAMRGIVPAPILDNRRKVGFNAPILDLLRADDPQVRSAVLADSPIFDHVRRDAIVSVLDKPFLANSESKFLFYFLCAKFFLEAFDGAAGR